MIRGAFSSISSLLGMDEKTEQPAPFAEAKQIFLELIAHTGEQTHLDFKTCLLSSKNIVKDREKAEAMAYEDLLKQIMHMYNAPPAYGEYYESFSSGRKEASYIVFGIECKETKKQRFASIPLDPDIEPVCRLNETKLQDYISNRFSCSVAVTYQEITIESADVAEHKWLKLGAYGLLEIKQNPTQGPVQTLFVESGKYKQEKNKHYGKVCTRTQATNHTLSADCRGRELDLLREVYDKFSDGHTEFLDELQCLQKDISSNDSMKALIINRPMNTECADFQLLCDILGCVQWNFIIDTDDKSDDMGGFYIRMKDSLQYGVTKATPKHLKNDGERKRLQLATVHSGQSCLYVFSRGLESMDDVSKTESSQNTALQFALAQIFGHIHIKRPVEIFFLALGESRIRDLKAIHACIKAAWNEECEDEDLLRFYFLTTHKGILSIFENYIKRESFKRAAAAPLGQVAELFDKIASVRRPNQSQRRVPSSGNAEGVSVSDEDYDTICKHYKLYHINMGVPMIETKTPDSDQEYQNPVDDIPLDAYLTHFLQGNEISDYLLHAHRRSLDIGYAERYVQKRQSATEKDDSIQASPSISGPYRTPFENETTTEIIQLEDLLMYIRARLRSKLVNKRTTFYNSVNDDIIRLQHETSAGGTTCGRILLHKLRKEYPCLELTSPIKDPLRLLETAPKMLFFRISRLPVLILIDSSLVGSKIALHDVHEMLRRFLSARKNDEFLSVVVLYIEKTANSSEKLSKGSFLLTTKLHKEQEVSDFDKLYSIGSSHLADTPVRTVGLYGLCQFIDSPEDYSRLDCLLSSIALEATEMERKLLLVCSIATFYGDVVVPSVLAAHILGIFGKEACQINSHLNAAVLTHLGTTGNFLLIKESSVKEHRRNGLMLPTGFVAQKVIQAMLKENKDPLSTFIDAFSQLARTITDAQGKTALNLLIQPIFIYRETVETGDGMHDYREKFSSFVQALENEVMQNMTFVVHKKKGREEEKTKAQVTEVARKLKILVEAVQVSGLQVKNHLLAMYARYLAYQVDNIEDALEVMRKSLEIKPLESFSNTLSRDRSLLNVAAHMLVMYLNFLSTMGDAEFSTLLKKAKPVVSDAFALVKRTQQIKHDAHSEITEARIYLQYMEFHFKRKFGKNGMLLSKEIRQSRDPVLFDSDKRMLKILDELEQFAAENFIENLDDSAIRTIGRLRFNLLNLIVDLRDPEALMDACKKNMSCGHCIVDYYLHRGERRRMFDQLSTDEYRFILSVFQEHNDQLLRNNYRFAVLALIRIYGREPRHNFGSLEMAYKYAKNWVERFPKDYRSLYYLSLLTLAEYLSASIKSNCSTSSGQQGDNEKLSAEDLCSLFHLRFQAAANMFESKKKFDSDGIYRAGRIDFSFAIQNDTSLAILRPIDRSFCKERQDAKFAKLLTFTGIPISRTNNKLRCKMIPFDINISTLLRRQCSDKWEALSDLKFYLQVSPWGFDVIDIV